MSMNGIRSNRLFINLMNNEQQAVGENWRFCQFIKQKKKLQKFCLTAFVTVRYDYATETKNTH